MKRSVGKFGSGLFVWALSLENFHSIARVWGPSFGMLRFGALALHLRFGAFDWNPLLVNLRFSFPNFRLGDFAQIGSFGNFRLGTLAWDLWLVLFGLGSEP